MTRLICVVSRAWVRVKVMVRGRARARARARARGEGRIGDQVGLCGEPRLAVVRLLVHKAADGTVLRLAEGRG